ncbi:MAG TPA: nuclear transport factor 2 family protein [Saprospiraceae bacterium]|nr:nuclear transport factor 2 family protein [Saprospiraceae bacterium]
MNTKTIFLSLTVALFLNACASSKQTAPLGGNVYIPVSKEVYDEIVAIDKKFFDAYNTCDLSTADSLLSDDIEFYHDLGGLSTSKTQLMDGLKNNICGKVTRVLKEGSIEVYPIKDYGAVQMGIHGFYNRAEKNEIKYAKFVHIWRLDGGVWRLTRVVSLH